MSNIQFKGNKLYRCRIYTTASEPHDIQKLYRKINRLNAKVKNLKRSYASMCDQISDVLSASTLPDDRLPSTIDDILNIQAVLDATTNGAVGHTGEMDEPSAPWDNSKPAISVPESEEQESDEPESEEQEFEEQESEEQEQMGVVDGRTSEPARKSPDNVIDMNEWLTSNERPELNVEETPVEETPVEETPVEEAPVEETPVEEAPVEEAYVEEAPVEETTHVEETHVEVMEMSPDAPLEQSVDTSHVKEESESEEEEETNEVEEEEAELEVEEYVINNTRYYVSDKVNGTIYSITPDDDIGDMVGFMVKGKPNFR
jgi:hypothetical protein